MGIFDFLTYALVKNSEDKETQSKIVKINNCSLSHAISELARVERKTEDLERQRNNLHRSITEGKSEPSLTAGVADSMLNDSIQRNLKLRDSIARRIDQISKGDV